MLVKPKKKDTNAAENDIIRKVLNTKSLDELGKLVLVTFPDQFIGQDIFGAKTYYTVEVLSNILKYNHNGLKVVPRSYGLRAQCALLFLYERHSKYVDRKKSKYGASI